MDDTRIETPEDFAARIIGTGNSATQIEIRKLAAEVIRARDIHIATWCEHKAAEGDEEARVGVKHDGQDSWHAAHYGGQSTGLRGVARTLVAK